VDLNLLEREKQREPKKARKCPKGATNRDNDKRIAAWGYFTQRPGFEPSP
jgi:hypothetical protein